MTDAEIIELFCNRDERAIRATEESYRHCLMGIAMQILGDEEDAKECLNDSYLTAWETVPEYRPEYLCAFLCKIVRRKAIDRVRRDTRKKRKATDYTLSLEEFSEILPGDGNPDESLNSEQLRESIQKFLKSQKPTERQLFLRRYFLFEPLNVAAGKCGMSDSKAKSILFRLRNRLKGFLKKEGFRI